MPRLLIINGPNVGVTYELGDRTRIGRLGENEIQVPDPNVSRIHSEIVFEHDAHVIYDRGSKNGIMINGEATAEKQLQPGDEIIIGGCTFLFDGAIRIQNARFSNNSVYFLQGTDNADKTADAAIGLETLKDSKREEADQLQRIIEIFEGSPAPFPVVAERLCERIRTYFQADHAVLLMQNTSEAEMRPVEATPHGKPVCVNAGLLNRVLEEKRPLSLTEVQQVPAACGLEDEKTEPLVSDQSLDAVPGELPMDSPQLKSSTKDVAEDATVSMLCAPLLADGNVKGLLLISRRGADAFPLQNLATLHSIAAFALILVQSANAAEILSLSGQALPLNPEQRAASTRSLRMQEIYNSARRSADGAGTVLITGEIGTGKETLARFVHETSAHAGGPFVVVNCAGIPPELFETELFGVEKGATENNEYTLPGKAEQAHGGTLFLDEVGELELSLQPKLLRFLQDRAFYRVGASHAVEADIKVIAASTLDLAAAVRAGKFREDLWYRLNVIPFHMPPLRERREDIGPLVDFFIARHAHRLNRRVFGANDTTIGLLQKYDWPGNIRELDNAVERAVLLCDSKILSNSDFSNIEEARRRLNSQADLERKRDTKPLAEVERQHIIIALKKHNFNQARAAEALGLHRNTLRNKIIEYGIDIAK